MSIKTKATGNKKSFKKRNISFMSTRRAVTAMVCFLFFVFISYFVITRETLVFDTVIREYLYSLRNDSLTIFFSAITRLGNWNTITAICFLLLLVPHVRNTFGIPLSATGILASLIQKVLKISFHRARPDLSLHLIQQGGYAFPSGHSFSVLIFYGMLLFLCRRYLKNRTIANLITVLLSCLIPLIGISRVYLGVHYPTDVLGGWSLGLCILMLLISGLHFYQREKLPRP